MKRWPMLVRTKQLNWYAIHTTLESSESLSEADYNGDKIMIVIPDIKCKLEMGILDWMYRSS